MNTTWRFPDQPTPRWQQKRKGSYLTWETVRAHLGGCWRRAGLSGVSRVSAPPRLLAGHHVLCSHAEAARWRRRSKTLHRDELFLKPSSHCAAGGALRGVLGWRPLHQTGRLWGTREDFKINKSCFHLSAKFPERGSSIHRVWICFSTNLQTFGGK